MTTSIRSACASAILARSVGLWRTQPMTAEESYLLALKTSPTSSMSPASACILSTSRRMNVLLLP
jgi:hypothetical protein